MRKLLRRLWYIVRQRRMQADLAEEMAFHREMNAKAGASSAFGSTAMAGAFVERTRAAGRFAEHRQRKSRSRGHCCAHGHRSSRYEQSDQVEDRADGSAEAP